jgi:hypothetical protein
MFCVKSRRRRGSGRRSPRLSRYMLHRIIALRYCNIIDIPDGEPPRISQDREVRLSNCRNCVLSMGERNDINRRCRRSSQRRKRCSHSNNMKLCTRNRQGFAVHSLRNSRCDQVASRAAAALCESHGRHVLERIQRFAHDCNFVTTTPTPAADWAVS